MGLQLILCVETNKKTQSDYIYIKETIEHFYKYDSTQVKISPVYMDGKTHYKEKQKDINNLIKKYGSVSSCNKSIVIYFFDCDNYDTKKEDEIFLKKVQEYCKANGYYFGWFCKDIERVYIGKKVTDKQKGKEAVSFKRTKQINHISKDKLTRKHFVNNTSNICYLLDQIFIENNIISHK